MSLDYRDEEVRPEEPQDFERPHPRENAFRPGPPIYAIVIIALYSCVFLAELARGVEPAILAAGFDKRSVRRAASSASSVSSRSILSNGGSSSRPNFAEI